MDESLLRTIRELSELDEADDFHQKTWKKLIGLYQAEKALQVTKQHNQDQAVQRLVRKTQDGTLGQPDGEMSDEDTQIRIGDEVNFHRQPQVVATKTSWWQPVVAAAAIGVGGAGITAAIMNQPTFKDTDTDTRNMLRFADESDVIVIERK